MVGCLAALTFFLLWHFWLFRKVSVANPALGWITYKFRWGFAHEIERDIDQDGRIDQRIFLYPGEKEFTTHQIPAEIWIDADHDGKFEARGTFDGKGIARIEIDADDNGQPERILDRDKALEFLNAMNYTPAYLEKVKKRGNR